MEILKYVPKEAPHVYVNHERDICLIGFVITPTGKYSSARHSTYHAVSMNKKENETENDTFKRALKYWHDTARKLKNGYTWSPVYIKDDFVKYYGTGLLRNNVEIEE